MKPCTASNATVSRSSINAPHVILSPVLTQDCIRQLSFYHSPILEARDGSIVLDHTQLVDLLTFRDEARFGVAHGCVD